MTLDEGQVIVAGFSDRYTKTRSDAVIMQAGPGSKPVWRNDYDAGLPGWKAPWSPTSPAYYVPDNYRAVTKVADGFIAVGSSYNVPARASTAIFNGAEEAHSSDLLVTLVSKTGQRKRVVRWKPSEKGYWDSRGLRVATLPSGEFFVSGVIARSKGTNLDPVIVQYEAVLLKFSANGELKSEVRFGQDAVPLAMAIGTDSVWVVTRSGHDVIPAPGTAWKWGGARSFIRYQFDLEGRNVLEKWPIFANAEMNRVSNVDLFPSGAVLLISSEGELNEAKAFVWKGAFKGAIHRKGRAPINVELLPAAGRGGSQAKYFATASEGGQILLARHLNRYWGETPKYDLLSLSEDGSLKNLGGVEDNRLGDEKERGRGSDPLYLTSDEKEVCLLVLARWAPPKDSRFSIVRWPK